MEEISLRGSINGNNTIAGVIRSNTLTGNVIGTGRIVVEKDYEELENKPQINDVELIGNKSLEDLNTTRLTNIEIDNIINSIV